MATTDKDNEGADDMLGSFVDENSSYLAYLEGRGAKAARMNPTGPDALQVQADYLHELGDHQHPFDVLRRISLNPWCSPKDRIAAAKALLEYTAAKMPTKIEQEVKEAKTIELDNKALTNLSGEELDLMIKLLDKANGLGKM